MSSWIGYEVISLFVLLRFKATEEGTIEEQADSVS